MQGYAINTMYSINTIVAKLNSPEEISFQRNYFYLTMLGARPPPVRVLA